MSLKQLPSNERPREKLINNGPSTLSDAELLAILLRTGTRGKSAIVLAQELLQHFGGIRQLVQTDYNSFCQAQGISRATYAQLHAGIEIAQRSLVAKTYRQKSIKHFNEVVPLLRHYFNSHRHEVFVCLYLNSGHQLLAIETLFQGSIEEVTVYLRPLVSRALHHQASALIIAHNHPSGRALPSNADIELTQTIIAFLNKIDVNLLDHIIVTQDKCQSIMPWLKNSA